MVFCFFSIKPGAESQPRRREESTQPAHSIVGVGGLDRAHRLLRRLFLKPPQAVVEPLVLRDHRAHLRKNIR